MLRGVHLTDLPAKLANFFWAEEKRFEEIKVRRSETLPISFRSIRSLADDWAP